MKGGEEGAFNDDLEGKGRKASPFVSSLEIGKSGKGLEDPEILNEKRTKFSTI